MKPKELTIKLRLGYWNNGNTDITALKEKAAAKGYNKASRILSHSIDIMDAYNKLIAAGGSECLGMAVYIREMIISELQRQYAKERQANYSGPDPAGMEPGKLLETIQKELTAGTLTAEDLDELAATLPPDELTDILKIISEFMEGGTQHNG